MRARVEAVSRGCCGQLGQRQGWLGLDTDSSQERSLVSGLRNKVEPAGCQGGRGVGRREKRRSGEFSPNSDKCRGWSFPSFAKSTMT